MVEHCRKRGVILMEAFMWRHQPRTLRLLEMVRDGAIGTLRLIRSSFSFPIEAGDWRLDPGAGGGALFDVGCYGVSTARLFAGDEPEKVRALAHFGVTRRRPQPYRSARIPVRLAGRDRLQFRTALSLFVRARGKQGSHRSPRRLPAAGKRKPSAVLRTLGSRSDSGAAADEVRTLEFEFVDQYAAMVDAFAASAASGRLTAPAEDGLAQMFVLDWVRAAALS